MSVDQYQRAVNGLDKEIADLEKKKAAKDKDIASLQSKIVSTQKSINKNTSQDLSFVIRYASVLSFRGIFVTICPVFTA